MTKCVRQHKVVNCGKLQKSESSLICVIIAEGSTNALPVSTISVHDVLVNKKSNASLVFILFSTKENLVSFLSCYFAIFHLILQSPRMFHLYLSISCSWSFLSVLRILVVHVLMVTLSLPRIVDDAPVACLTPPSWCREEGAAIVNPGGDRPGMVWLLVFISW